ncbi:ABC transporter substrate-binding protein [Ruminococcaceae bacterium OttesenSCG-928-L11]|nr:ABC transporter substrate-binding protein [Ruminococcaceae bacterium OttesenSCG-928-L11]
MKRKASILLLALAMVVSMAACGGNTTSSSGGSTSSTAPSASTGSAAAGTSETATPAENDLRESSLVTLDVVTMASGKEQKDIDLVAAAMNELLEEKFNCNVRLTFLSFATYAEQTTLMLSSGSGADILPVYMIPLPTAANAGQIIPLDDLLDKYGAGIREQIGEYVECGRVGDAIYGITTGRDLASTQGFAMRKDLCDKYDIDYENIKTLDQLKEALVKIKEGEENVWPVAVSAGENIRNWGWDPLGDDMVNLGVLADMAQTTEVVNLFETQQYSDLANTMYEWMNEGLIQSDAVNTTEVSSSLLQAGTAFGYFTNLKPGYAAENTASLGIEIVVSEMIDALASTNNVSRATWTISSGCKNPDAAMKVLNELYTSPELGNLYMYGIEGTHYKVVEAGGSSNGQDIINYADGLDATTSGYRKSGTWLTPNQFIGHTWFGSTADYWDVTRKFNDDALKSKAFGFTYDSANVNNEVTACTNVVAKYHKALMCGALNPAETLPKFNQELKDAGIDRIIAEKQTQLDAWYAEYGA